MLCGALSTTSVVVPTILPLPLATALPSLSQFCPPTCPLLDSISILQVVRILASSRWPGQFPASSCSFPNGPGCPGDWGFLSLPTFSGSICLRSFLGSLLWLSGSSDREWFSFMSFIGPSTNFFQSLCCSVPTPSPVSRRVSPSLGAPPPPGPVRYPGDLPRASAPLLLPAFPFNEPSCLSSEGSS